jgi:spore germination protein YaaH
MAAHTHATLLRRLLPAIALALVAVLGAFPTPAATAQAPPPTTGSVHAFLFVADPSSFADFQAHYRQIGTVYPTFFHCDRTTGRILGSDVPQITRFAQERKVAVLARVNCQTAAVLHRILTEPALRQATLDAIVALVAENGYDGVNIDFESAPPSDRAAFTAFITDLATRLHAAGDTLSVDVSAKQRDEPTHPRSGVYDYPALARAADHVFVMAWGIHWQTSPPGPLADWPWFTGVLDYVAAQPTPERYVIGAPLYGFDWPNGGGPQHPGTALQYEDMIALAARVGAIPQRDPSAREQYFAYTDSTGLAHTAWFLDAQAVVDRFDAARAQGFERGVWRLGREDQTLWSRVG